MLDKNFMEEVNKLWSIIHHPLFKINKMDFSLLTMFGTVLIVAAGIFAAKYYKKYVNSLVENPKFMLKQETATMLSILGYYFILTSALLLAIGYTGINLTSFTIIMSALSVGIGFGLQAILSNFVSGIVLLFENSIKIGDHIEVNSGLVGKITDIRMRYTSVLTYDNIEVLVPNKAFIENNVINWTLSDRIKRLKVPFSVAYGTDADTVDAVIIPAIMNLEKDFLKNDENRLPRCVMTSLGDNGVNFELWIWIKVGITNQTPPSISLDDILRTIYKTLNDNNIEIPFPQQDVHLVSIPERLQDINI